MSSSELRLPSLCNGFAPIIPQSPKVLVLGTMPSVASLGDHFYYAHPRNAFWPVIQSLSPTMERLDSNERKRQAILELGILLWDVLQECERQGSLDSAIQKPVANEFTSVFTQFPNLKQVIFNGQAAEKLFKKHVLRAQRIPDDLIYTTMTSTSPANARLKIEDKVLLWQEKLSKIL